MRQLLVNIFSSRALRSSDRTNPDPVTSKDETIAKLPVGEAEWDGKSENREALDVQFYRACYSDLSSLNDDELAKHWELQGQIEKRYANANHALASALENDALPEDFSVESYLQFNEDLIESIEWPHQAVDHYLRFGVSENRPYKQQEKAIELTSDEKLDLKDRKQADTVDLDYTFYRRNYPDLIELNDADLLAHWKKHGQIENRFASSKHAEEVVKSRGELPQQYNAGDYIFLKKEFWASIKLPIKAIQHPNMSVDICCVVNAHREENILFPTIKSAQRSIAYAEKCGLTCSLLVVMDNTDEITREIAYKAGAGKAKIDIVDFRDLALSRNYASSQSNGKYTAFLDGDDLCSENWLFNAHATAERIDEPVILHPEYNIFFGGDFDHAFNHVDMDAQDFEYESFFQQNFWTALSFGKSDIYRKHSYRKNAIMDGFGFEDWTWNYETISQGIKHKIVPSTVHFIRKGKPQESLLAKTNSVHALPRILKLYRSPALTADHTISTETAMPTRDLEIKTPELNISEAESSTCNANKFSDYELLISSSDKGLVSLSTQKHNKVKSLSEAVNNTATYLDKTA